MMKKSDLARICVAYKLYYTGVGGSNIKHYKHGADLLTSLNPILSVLF